VITHPRIVRGSDEERLYGVIAQRQPVRRDTAAAAAGLRPDQALRIFQRLRSSGMVASIGGARPVRWILGRDPGVRTADRGRIGLHSAVRNTFDGDAELSAIEIAELIGATAAEVCHELVRLAAANAIVRSGPLDAQRQLARYRRRPAQANVVHLFGFRAGEGERRDCANYERCLDQFTGGGPAHCPRKCAGFKPVAKRDLLDAAMVSRRTQWTETAHG
jgi:hypothetical protein